MATTSPSRSSLPRKIIDVNRTFAGMAVHNTAEVVKTVGRNTKNVIDAAREAGKIVTGQTTSVVERTVTTARNGTREVSGQVMAQGARVSDAVRTQANRTVDAAQRAIDDRPASGTPYEQWTKAQLMERARELDLEGRATMSKPQLIKALRS